MNWPPEAKVNLRILIDKSEIFKINQAIRVCINHFIKSND